MTLVFLAASAGLRIVYDLTQPYIKQRCPGDRSPIHAEANAFLDRPSSIFSVLVGVYSYDPDECAWNAEVLRRIGDRLSGEQRKTVARYEQMFASAAMTGQTLRLSWLRYRRMHRSLRLAVKSAAQVACARHDSGTGFRS